MDKRDGEKPVFEIIKELGECSIEPGSITMIGIKLRKNLIELKDRFINFLLKPTYEGDFFEVSSFNSY